MDNEVHGVLMTMFARGKTMEAVPALSRPRSWRSRGAAALAGMVLVAAGCSEGPQDPAPAAAGDGAPVLKAGPAQEMTTTDGEVFLPEGPSAEQAAALEDGVVTREEYEAGFRRFEACMTELGIELLDVDMNAPVLSASYLTQGTVEEENCFYAEFGQIDTSWQIENNDHSVDVAALASCLEANGVKPAHDVGEKTIRQFETLEAQRVEAGISESLCVTPPPS